MNATAQPAAAGKGLLWTGWVLTGLLAAFLVFDGIGKVLMIEPVRKACDELGITESVVPGIGVVLIASACLYVIPQTTVLGAILLTGFLGGAVATHVRLGGPTFPIVFATLMGMLVWLAIYLREPRLRVLLPVRR